MTDSFSDSGVSEMVGALMLIAIIGLGVSIAGVYLVDKTTNEKIPDFRASISNTSRNLTLHHDGGDPIPRSNFEILVNGNPTEYVSSQNQSPDWSIDDTLIFYTYDPATPLPDVKIVYTGPAGARVLSDFSSYIPQTTAPTITVTATITSPTPCPPYTSFTFFPTNPDTNTLVIFTDISSCVPTSWYWDFGDGTNSTTQHPTHTFTTANTYYVTLTRGTGNTKTLPITVTPYVPPNPPVANFTTNITTGCSPLDVQFTDQSTGNPTNWSWSFGDGEISTLQNPPHTYLYPGMYNVSLTAMNGGGPNTKTELDYISVGPPVANFTSNETIGCLPMTVQFNDTSTRTPMLWAWTFGDGTFSTEQNPVKTYTTAGTYNVTLIASNTCGNSSPFTRTNYITVGQVPVANFFANWTTGCLPMTVQFTNSSSGATTFDWDFGDGATSSEQNPVKTYSTVGNYNVSLNATNSCGSDIRKFTNYIMVGTPVTGANFTADTRSGCIPFTVHFSGSATGMVKVWLWDFGDGGSSTDQNPVHTYQTTGDFLVNLTVLDYCGGHNTSIISNYIHAATAISPPASKAGGFWTLGEGTGTTVQDSSGHGNTGTINSGSWVNCPAQGRGYLIFNGNSTYVSIPNSTSLNPLDQISFEAWVYTVEQNTTKVIQKGDWNGHGIDQDRWEGWQGGVTLSDGTKHDVTWYPGGGIHRPLLQTWYYVVLTYDGTALRIYVNGTEMNSIPLTGALKQVNAPVIIGSTTSQKYFNGSIANAAISTYALAPCEVLARYQAFTPQGCPPTVNFTANKTTGCAPQTIQFTDLTTGSPTSWAWNFGDGDISTSQNPVKTYGTNGIYNVTLTTSNIFGTNQFTRTNYITVGRIPVPNFSANRTTGCLPMTVQFADSSTGLPTNWTWSFGDGATSNLQNPARTYTTAGTYNVTLIASNTCGNSSPFTQTNYITVGRIPVVNFTANPTSGAVPLAVQFTDQSTGNPTNWTWNFGDGSPTVTVQNPGHTYSARGNYSVRLTAINECGSGIVTKVDYIQVRKKSFVDFIIDENVFVYGNELNLDGDTATGPNATVVITGPLSTSDLNHGASVDVTTIYINGNVDLDGGSAGLGSASDPGNIYVNGNLKLGSGSRNIYGDVYVAGDFELKDARIHGIVYVDGDLELKWTPWLAPDARIYYTGTIKYPTSFDPDILAKCIHQTTVPGFDMPDQEIPPVKPQSWYNARGYVSSGTLTSNLKIFANSYTSATYRPSAYNVTIIARDGDITLTKLGSSVVTGVLFAPKGKVTFEGGSFEGLVIARDGFSVISGGTEVIFRNLAYYFSNPDDYPF